MASTFADHLKTIQSRWDAALSAQSLDAVLIAAGAPRAYFLDDQHVPFRPNPHFRQWIPYGEAEHSLLLIRPGQQPQLYFFQPKDFWHLPPSVPAEIDGLIRVEIFDDRIALARRALSDLAQHNRAAVIGEDAEQLDLGSIAANPAGLLDHVHWYRALKTPFERQCLAHATEIAVAGHLAAQQAFAAGGSEYDVHMAYLTASRQNEFELPYRSIVGLDSHAGTLHYQHYDRHRRSPTHTLLIDAGATYLGYASDITRTYAAADLAGARPADEAARTFSGLLRALDERQEQLTAFVKPGLYFPALQEQAHRDIAELLVRHELLHCSAEEAFDCNLTDAFFPHGLGHLLGLQTHDVGGHLGSPAGGTRPPDARFPNLRLTRPIEADMALTIEPGIYFIPMLLEPLRGDARAGSVNWRLIDALLPYGGIRIEDNVVATTDGAENLTRMAFAGTLATGAA
jgi:Xaa-Pro dipeptidase